MFLALQEKENIFCGGEEKRRRVGRNIFGEGKYFFVEEKKKEILIDLVS